MDNQTITNNNWQLYWGYAVEPTTTPGQRMFYVYCPDLFPTQHGDLSLDMSGDTATLVNVDTGEKLSAAVKQTKTLHCELLLLTSDQRAPVIAKGQQGFVLNYAHSDRWFFIPFDRDDCLKTFSNLKLQVPDIATIHKSNEEKPGDTESRHQGLTDDNCYLLELDTKYRKRIRMKTAGSDAERFILNVEMDAEAQTIELWTNQLYNEKHRNTIKIEANRDHNEAGNTGRITLENSSGAQIILDEQDIYLKAPRDIHFITGRNMLSLVEGEFAQTTKGDYALKTYGFQGNWVGKDLSQQVVGDIINQCTNLRSTQTENTTVTTTLTYTATQADRICTTEKTDSNTSTDQVYQNTNFVNKSSNVLSLMADKLAITAETGMVVQGKTIGLNSDQLKLNLSQTLNLTVPELLATASGGSFTSSIRLAGTSVTITSPTINLRGVVVN